MQIREQVRSFISSNFFLPESEELADGSSLLDQGIIDSTGVLELILFLEETFSLTVEDSEMLPENLDSVDSITTFVTGKKG